MIYYLLCVFYMSVVADACFGQLNFRQKGSDNFYTGLGPCGLSVKSGFVLMSFSNDHQECLTIGYLAETNIYGVFGAYFHGIGVYPRVWQFSSLIMVPSSHYYCTTGYATSCRLVLVLSLHGSFPGTQATQGFVLCCTCYVPSVLRYSGYAGIRTWLYWLRTIPTTVLRLRKPRRNFFPYHGYMEATAYLPMTRYGNDTGNDIACNDIT